MEQLDHEQDFVSRFELYRREYSTLKDATYYSLRDAILLNYFQNEIAEAQISSILNISRTPIREAMLQLSRDGLLDISHGRKAKIIPLTPQDLTDISVILDNLHSLSIALCVDRADEMCIRDRSRCGVAPAPQAEPTSTGTFAFCPASTMSLRSRLTIAREVKLFPQPR